MPLTFLHTADLHLGKTFNFVEGDAGAGLRQKRLDAVTRLADLAAEHHAAFVLIAGDTFDSPTVDDRVLIQACERFKQFAVPVYILPGNHDPDAGPGSGSVWRRKAFVDHQPKTLHVLTDPAPVRVDGHDAVILPAPLRYKSVAGDPTAHFTADLGRDLLGVTDRTFRIGLAHGSVVDFGANPDGVPGNLAQDRADRAGIDYLALGDWHGQKIVNPRTAYAGAPEPTGFRDNGAGNALVVTLGAHRTPPAIHPLPVTTTRWLRKEAELTTPDDLSELAAWFDQLDRPTDTLVRLDTRGGLPLTHLQTLEALLDTQSHRLLHLRRRGPGVHAQPTEDEIDALAPDGYLREAVAELRAAARAEGDDARAAADALHLLHRLQAETTTPRA